MGTLTFATQHTPSYPKSGNKPARGVSDALSGSSIDVRGIPMAIDDVRSMLAQIDWSTVPFTPQEEAAMREMAKKMKAIFDGALARFKSRMPTR